MEQVKNARRLVDAIGSTPVRFETGLETSYRDGPRSAWARLSEVTPDPVVLARNMLVAASPCPVAVQIDVLRTRVMAQMRTLGAKRLAVTSPRKGSGTTTLVGNLALSLARQPEMRIIVFDLNLRNPSLIRAFGLSEVGPRFSALCGTRRNFDTSCLRIGGNLALSLNMTTPQNPTELLGAIRSRDLVERIERDFEPDLMLFDLPPILPNDDARTALGMVDQALIVAMSDQTAQIEIQQTEQIVEAQGKSLGVVLSKCRFPGRASTRPLLRWF